MQHYGWIPPTVEQTKAILRSLPHPVFYAAAPYLMQEVVDKIRLGDKTDVYLYKAWINNLGSYPSYVPQAESDCTSFSSGHNVDLIQCVQKIIDHQETEYLETCTEAIYGGGREIADMLGQGGGCYGGSVAKSCVKFGIVPRKDVGPYSRFRAIEWGTTGVPSDIKSLMSNHKIQTTSLVTTWNELVAALTNGYPVISCSSQGFEGMRRNDKGIVEASGSWQHAMLWAGIMYSGTPDEGAVICNSWGDKSTTGPCPNDIPLFSWVVRRRVVEKMLAQQDSYAFSRFNGYVPQILPQSWTYQDWSGF